MHAAYNGRTDVVALLLERSAQPNIGHDQATHTALDFAEMQARILGIFPRPHGPLRAPCSLVCNPL